MSATDTPIEDQPAVTSMTSQVQLGVWIALIGPIAAWTVHLVALASMIQLTCAHPPVKWVLHGLTIGLGLFTIGCMAFAWRTMHLPNGEDAGTTSANIRFLSRVAFLVAAINLLLIFAEGVYIAFLSPCSRA
jgi:hypothetical protein